MLMNDNTVFVPVEDPNMSLERTKNARLDVKTRLGSFEEIEKTYTEDEALREASRCLGCPSRWCSMECPIGNPIPEMIKAVRAGDYAAAYELLSTNSPLPEFCSRLCPQEKQCQSNCTRSIRGQAVGIGRLERFVVEQHYASGAKEVCAPANGKRVAVIGSGPSGLAAAVTLAKSGCAVTVFEKEAKAGGLLRYGIPGMKLPDEILDRKLAAMTDQLGISFVTGTAATPETVQNFDAAILAIGTGNARKLTIAGSENTDSIVPAVDYLSGRSGRTAAGKHVIIIGGGDTGNDCLGTALRQGAASVTQVEMLPKVTTVQHIFSPLYAKQKEAKFDSSQEEFLTKNLKDPHIYQATVKAVETDDAGQLTVAELVHLEAYYDDARRLNMRELPGSTEMLPCNLIIIAAGFLGPQADTVKAFGVNTNPRSNILGYATNVPGLYACGDCHTGQSLVVKSMGDGKKCAEAVLDALK